MGIFPDFYVTRVYHVLDLLNEKSGWRKQILKHELWEEGRTRKIEKNKNEEG